MTDRGRQPPSLKIGLTTLYWCELSGARNLFRLIVSALIVKPEHEFILLAPPPDIDVLHRSSQAVFGRISRFMRLPTIVVRFAQRLERMIRSRSLGSGTHITTRMQREAFAWLGPEILEQMRFHSTEYSREGMERAAIELGLDVALPAAKLMNVPSVTYLYDCQHRYLPENFTTKKIDERNRHFELMVRNSKALVVNSRHTKSDLIAFFDADPNTVFALPFVSLLIPEWLQERPELLEGYSLPDRYFIVSNQFWVHKSLDTVIRALHALTRQGADDDLHVVFTGRMDDPRFPDYADGLVRLADDLGLSNRVQFLGYIPTRDQIEMLKNAVAVIQPTLFEGAPGGGSVILAVGLGVRTIVSDIEVNQELPANSNQVFFHAGDHDDLAAQMRALWNDHAFQRAENSELLQRNTERMTTLTNTLYRAIEAAMSP